MTELEKLIKTAVYGSVGAIATIAEKSGELLQIFVDKGEEVVRQGQTVTEEAVKKFKEVWEEADIDVSHMTQEQREALRRRLEELEKAEREAVNAFNEALRRADEADAAAKEAGKRAMEAEDAYEAARAEAGETDAPAGDAEEEPQDGASGENLDEDDN